MEDDRHHTPLRADQMARLSWLCVVVAKRVGIDYLRAHPDYVLDYAKRAFPGEEHDALELLCNCESFEEIARALGGVPVCEETVRAAIERMCRQFREDGDGDFAS